MRDRIPRLRQAIGLLAVLLAGAVLATIGGPIGAVFGLAALGAWVVGPPVFGFVFAQSGLAAVSPPAESALLVSAELGLLTMLLADPQIQLSLRRTAGLIGGVGVFVGAAWVIQPLPIWVTAGFVLLGVAGGVYALHRFELLTTGQLNQQ